MAQQKTITLTVSEYRNLVSCMTMLDVILNSKSESGYYDCATIKSVEALRKYHVDMILIKDIAELEALDHE